MYTSDKYKLCFIILVINLMQINAQLLEGLYCGKSNCYDVLGVTRESTRSEISKNYRALAKKFHPDLHRGEEAKKTAETQFKIIAQAYEILRDDEARNDYDYMLDNPNEYYAHYYRYYRRRVSPKVDVRLVIFVTITLISIIQYYSAWNNYETAIKYFMTVPKYRHKAMDIAQSNSENILTNKKLKKSLTKAEQKIETEKMIRKIIEENMDIKGAYAKPEIYDILWVQLIILPYTILKYVTWYTSWVWNFTIKKKPYGEVEKLYLIRKFLKMGQNEFNAIEQGNIDTFLRLELWKRENFVTWKQQDEEEQKKTLADNPRYRQYRRYMKNHGPGRMVFED